jgi:hypothetical protein
MAVRRTEGLIKCAKGQREAAPSRGSVDAAAQAAKAGQPIWRGASGTLYTHISTSLLLCPELPEATYLLLHRDAAGALRVLRVGTLDSKARSLNLARLRQVGATLGANEVHFRIERSSVAERARISFDIENALQSGAALADASLSDAYQPA